MPSVQTGDLRVLGFFVRDSELIKHCPPEPMLKRDNVKPETLEALNIELGLRALRDKATMVFPERPARKYICEKNFVKGGSETGHVIAFADNRSDWHKDSEYHPLKKQLEDVREKIGLPANIVPRWYRVIA